MSLNHSTRFDDNIIAEFKRARSIMKGMPGSGC